MPESREQRECERVPADRPLEFRAPDVGAEGVGRLIDLSDGGAQFAAEDRIDPGTEVSLRIPREGVAPLLVAGQVVRCLPHEGDGVWAIACAFD